MAKKKAKKRATKKAEATAIMDQAVSTGWLLLSLQFAEMVARRIVEIGADLDTSVMAQVAGPLGLRPMMAEDIRKEPRRAK